MNKTALKNFAIWARKKLISDITYSAGLLAVNENGIGEPLPQSRSDLQLFDIGTKDYAEVKGERISSEIIFCSFIIHLSFPRIFPPWYEVRSVFRCLYYSTYVIVCKVVFIKFE